MNASQEIFDRYMESVDPELRAYIENSDVNGADGIPTDRFLSDARRVCDRCAEEVAEFRFKAWRRDTSLVDRLSGAVARALGWSGWECADTALVNRTTRYHGRLSGLVRDVPGLREGTVVRMSQEFDDGFRDRFEVVTPFESGRIRGYEFTVSTPSDRARGLPAYLVRRSDRLSGFDYGGDRFRDVTEFVKADIRAWDEGHETLEYESVRTVLPCGACRGALETLRDRTVTPGVY